MSDLVFGRRPVLELLQARKRSIHKLFVAEGAHGTEEAVRLAREQGAPVEFVRRERLDQMIRGHHQGLVAQASAAAFLELGDFLKAIRPHPSPLPTGEGELRNGARPSPLPSGAGGRRPGEANSLVIALDEIQDPQNVGAILRSAAFFGVDAVIAPKWRSAPVGDTAARTSSGAIEHLQMIRVGNLVQAIDELKEAGFEVLGADAEGAPLSEHQPSKRTVIVMGSEGKGLRRLVREHCDKLVGIPRRGRLDSLNVGAAAAIFLYELRRAR